MRKLGLALVLTLGIAPAQAQNAGWPPPAGAQAMLCVYNLVQPTVTTGQDPFVQCDANGNLKVVATFSPSGTQDVNLTQVGGVAVSLGQKTTAASIPVTLPSDASTLPVSFTPVNPTGITPTDRTVTSATGASQTVMSALATRKGLTIENTGNANCGINPTGGTAVIGGAGTLTLGPLGSYVPRIPTLSAVTAICTAGQPLYASEQ